MTLGPAVGRVAELIGKPLMPWQQHVADVSLEIDPLTGRLAYDEVGLTVPRQSGKTTLILAKAVHRCSATQFFGRRQNILYTAQTRAKARKKWEEEFVANLEASPRFKTRIDVHRGNGNEHLRFPNKSRFGPESNTEKAGHSETLDEAFIDEAFAHIDYRLEQAFGPAMITRRNKQLWWVSTAGWLDESFYLEEKVEVGRGAATADTGLGLAYFEWSAPDDADPGHPETWWGCMPALGYTITEEAIRSEYDKALRAGKLNEFLRPYLNRWVKKTVSQDSVIAPLKWSEGLDPDATPLASPPKFAIDASPLGERAAIVAAGLRSDGLPQIEVTSSEGGTIIDHRDGMEWLLPRLADMAKRWPAMKIGIAGNSSAKSLKPEIEALGIEVELLSQTDTAAACGLFYTKATTAGVRHLGQQPLTDAVVSAQKRDIGDGGLWVWSRPRSPIDITTLYAATIALWLLMEDAGDFSMFGGDLDMCDRCNEKPHEDPDGEHDYLCADCRELEEDD